MIALKTNMTDVLAVLQLTRTEAHVARLSIRGGTRQKVKLHGLSRLAVLLQSGGDRAALVILAVGERKVTPLVVVRNRGPLQLLRRVVRASKLVGATGHSRSISNTASGKGNEGRGDTRKLHEVVSLICSSVVYVLYGGVQSQEFRGKDPTSPDI